MATSTSIPLSEYLQTSYRPDCDYIDGEVKERNSGEQPHGHIQAIIASIFRENRKAWSTRAITETRVQTRPTRFRIPDICILRSSDPHDPIIRFAPYICIEVLSKDDTLMEIQIRTDEYRAMGVDHIWVVDPWLRIGYIASARGFEHPADGIFTVPGTPIRLVLADLFCRTRRRLAACRSHFVPVATEAGAPRLDLETWVYRSQPLSISLRQATGLLLFNPQ